MPRSKRARRKPLNREEAHSLLVEMTGNCQVKIRRLRGSGPQKCELTVFRGVADGETYRGKSWRNCLHNAGLYWEEGYD